MLCSLCLNHKEKCIELPCNHNLCIKCFSEFDHSQNTNHYQCQTCLQVHQLNLQQSQSQQNRSAHRTNQDGQNNTFYSQNGNKDIFCWTCHCSITLKQYIKGIHHQHKVQTFEQAIPSIKNVMLEQLQKTLSLKEYLEQFLEVLQNNRLKKDYFLIINKINDYFDKQAELIQQKRENVLKQLQIHYNKSLNQINKQYDFINPLTLQIHELQNKISSFLTDKAPITLIDPISEIMSTIMDYGSLIKQRKIQLPQLPNFIIKSNIKESIQDGCQLFQKYKAIDQQKKKQRKIFSRLKQNILDGQKHKNSSIFSSKVKQMSLYESKDNSSVNVNRKVKLVEKVRGKMRYTSSFCTTTFS